jgi:RHS repeat-associated protein
VAVLDSNASIVAKYNYDAWGKILSVTNASGTVQTASTFIGNINPIRYRGYYYDVETGLYYLQSRYYDPETGRFVNADNIVPKLSETMQDYNLYAYCADDPVNNEDPTGDFKSSITLKDIEEFSLNGYCTNGYVYVKRAFDANGVFYGNGYCRMGDMGNYLLYCAQRYEKQYYDRKQKSYEERYNAGSNNYGYEYYNPSTKSPFIRSGGSREHFKSITVPEDHISDSYTEMEPYDPDKIKKGGGIKKNKDTGFVEIFPNITI